MQTRWIIGATALLLAAGSWASAQSESCCKGGKQQQRRSGMMMDEDHQDDMAMFHFLLDNRSKIERTVTDLPDGVETLTESDDPEVASAIREHVAAMYRRLAEGRPIHRRDPLFAEIFEHADAIEMTMEKTEHGLRVRETSSDPYVAKLIQSHAQVLNAFVENGYPEMRKNHQLPERD
jgi:hypothetical protein